MDTHKPSGVCNCAPCCNQRAQAIRNDWELQAKEKKMPENPNVSVFLTFRNTRIPINPNGIAFLEDFYNQLVMNGIPSALSKDLREALDRLPYQSSNNNAGAKATRSPTDADRGIPPWETGP